MSSPPYFGQFNCHSLKLDGRPCEHKAYYRVGYDLLCGQHSRKHTHKRVQLPKMKKAPFDLAAQLETAKEVHGGRVKLQRIAMMKAVTQIEGWVCVFPNFRHGNRRDGFGIPQLSPMSLGPVEHGQPGLPPAKNLENFYQQSKRFGSEKDDDAFHQAKVAGYLDPVPHRHKIKKQRPIYWSWIDAQGVEHKLTYIQSRYFYCKFYEELAKQTEQWKRLYEMVKVTGLSTQICGYDAFPIEPTKEAITAAYLDPAHPFGHERVLFAMLVLEQEDYPWREAPAFCRSP